MLPYVALKNQEVHNGPKLLTYEANTLEDIYKAGSGRGTFIQQGSGSQEELV